MQGYWPFSENVLEASDDDEPLSVTESTVTRKLRAVSASRAGGLDHLPNWDILAPSISDILNTSFKECRVPRVGKLADAPPLLKASTNCDCNKDLRPISLMSTRSKIAESIVIEIIVKDLKPAISSSIEPGQFDFIPWSWTTFALISMLHRWLHATDGSELTVITALLDYGKALDLVDHHLLIAKLWGEANYRQLHHRPTKG